MSKSMGFEEENTYLDSKAVAHNKEPLNEFLDRTVINKYLGSNFDLNDIKTPRTIWILWKSY